MREGRGTLVVHCWAAPTFLLAFQKPPEQGECAKMRAQQTRPCVTEWRAPANRGVRAVLIERRLGCDCGAGQKWEIPCLSRYANVLPCLPQELRPEDLEGDVGIQNHFDPR